MSKKYDTAFMKVLAEHTRVDEATGNLTFSGLYASCYLNIGWKGGIVSVPHSHVVWFLKHGRWPRKDMFLDHVNDDPMDNRPDNLQELTQQQNQAKRRGRIVYRSYGTGKYGHGLGIHADKRDGRFYVTRHLSRGHGKGNVKKSLGGFDSLKEAKAAVKRYVAEIEANGPGHLPVYDGPREKRRSIELMTQTSRIRLLRKQGHTMQEIADLTGFSLTTIFNKTKGIRDKIVHKGDQNASSRYTKDQVARFKALRREGVSVPKAARACGIGRGTAYLIENGQAWRHVD
jgi:DNA-binding CsgD family transcriptional regulator